MKQRPLIQIQKKKHFLQNAVLKKTLIASNLRNLVVLHRLLQSIIYCWTNTKKQDPHSACQGTCTDMEPVELTARGPNRTREEALSSLHGHWNQQRCNTLHFWVQVELLSCFVSPVSKAGMWQVLCGDSHLWSRWSNETLNLLDRALLSVTMLGPEAISGVLFPTRK